MSNNIPEDIIKKIEEKYQAFFWTDEQFGFTNESPVPKMQRNASTWGYLLALEKLTEKDEEIDRLKKENNLFKAWNQMLKKRLEGMIKLTRKTRVAVKDEISKLKVENEKLKEHIEHLNECLDSYK